MAILSGILIPTITNYINEAKLSSDQATVKVLNNTTSLYRVNQTSSDPFKDESQSDATLLSVLVSSGLLTSSVEPQSKDASFSWVFEYERWFLILPNNSYVVTTSDGLTINSNGRLGASYIGSSMDIVIPKTLDGVIITNIYQDAFRSVGLTSLKFQADSEVTQIHARAFLNNNLTEIVLPNTIEKVDWGAFKDNNLNSITLGSNLSRIEGSAFGEYTTSFITAYASGGAGTYILEGTNWVKQ